MRHNGRGRRGRRRRYPRRRRNGRAGGRRRRGGSRGGRDRESCWRACGGRRVRRGCWSCLCGGRVVARGATSAATGRGCRSRQRDSRPVDALAWWGSGGFASAAASARRTTSTTRGGAPAASRPPGSAVGGPGDAAWPFAPPLPPQPPSDVQRMVASAPPRLRRACLGEPPPLWPRLWRVNRRLPRRRRILWRLRRAPHQPPARCRPFSRVPPLLGHDPALATRVTMSDARCFTAAPGAVEDPPALSAEAGAGAPTAPVGEGGAATADASEA